MSQYKIYICKTEENPNYKDEMAKYQDDTRGRNRFNGDEREQEPKPYTTQKFLDTVLSDAEFAVVKKAIIEVL